MYRVGSSTSGCGRGFAALPRACVVHREASWGFSSPRGETMEWPVLNVSPGDRNPPPDWLNWGCCYRGFDWFPAGLVKVFEASWWRKSRLFFSSFCPRRERKSCGCRAVCLSRTEGKKWKQMKIRCNYIYKLINVDGTSLHEIVISHLIQHLHAVTVRWCCCRCIGDHRDSVFICSWCFTQE